MCPRQPLNDRLAAIHLLTSVVIAERSEDAWPLAQALKAGGLPCAEVTFRAVAAEAALKVIAEDKSFCLGAGTILQPDQVDRAVAAGATCIVSPGFHAEAVCAAVARWRCECPPTSRAT